jgi:hypothetical protein
MVFHLKSSDGKTIMVFHLKSSDGKTMIHNPPFMGGQGDPRSSEGEGFLL